MAKRKSSYQKLKEENARLRADISLIIKGDSLTINRYKMVETIEKAIWSGTTVAGDFEGIKHYTWPSINT